MKILLSLFLLCAIATVSYGQLNEEDRASERKKIQQLFSDSFLRSTVKDTNEMVIFSVKVKVDNSTERLNVKSIELSDSTYVHYFKGFNFLKTVNYNKLTARRGKDLAFVFPVFLFITDEKKVMHHDFYGHYFYKNIGNLFFAKGKEAMEDYIYSIGIALWAIQEELY